MGEDGGGTHDHLPLRLISSPHLLRWSGVHARSPATPLRQHRSSRLSSTDIRTKQPRADMGLTVYTWATSSVNTLTWAYRPLLLLLVPPPPPRLHPGAVLTAAVPPTCSLHLAATMCLKPDKLSHRSPLLCVSPSMNKHLTRFNGTVRRAPKPNSSLWLYELRALYVWHSANVLLVPLVSCHNLIQRK